MDDKRLLLWGAFCGVGGALISVLSHLPFWGGAAITAVALLVNGVVADVEDRAPGGFLNPRNRQD